MKRLAIRSWRIYSPTGLVASPSVTGKSHVFEYRGRQVEVRIPTAPTRKNAKEMERKLVCRSWRKGHVPTSYWIREVSLYLSIAGTRAVPEDAIGRANRTPFTKRQQASLEKLCVKAEAASDGAFEHWLGIMRWATGAWYLGQPDVGDNKSGWSTYLVEQSSGERFYGGAHHLTAHYVPPISLRHWNRAARLLAAGAHPPIWGDFLFQAQHWLAVGNVSFAVISLAVSAEALLRALLTKHVARPPNATFVRLVNRLNISQVVESWSKLGFNSRRWQEAFDRRSLLALFEARNSLMHRGICKTTASECQNFVRAVRSLQSIGESVPAPRPAV
jgi:hypothetical protein